MYFCFVDESGTPPSAPNPNKPYFTLGAVIVSSEDWPLLENYVHGFRTSNKIFGELKWRYFSPHNSDKGNPLLGRDAQERKALSLSFLRLIANTPITIIASVTDVDAAYSYASVNNQQELYHFAYKPITERFQYFLQDNKGLGIVVADHRSHDNDRTFRAHHQELVGNMGTTRSKYDRFIEGLFLQDSCMSTGIQVADFVAGAIHRAYSVGDGAYATVLRPRFRTRNGVILGCGLVHHPSAKFNPKKAKKKDAG
jgi:hypothetical protein